MTTELQVRLERLSAPGRLVDWARPFPDLESCWNVCKSPELLLWLAARLSRTSEERRAIVACLVELTRRAAHGSRHADPPVERAAGTAETWVRTGTGLDDLLAAERAAAEAATWAAIVAAEKGERARLLLRSAPRGRPASLATGRAFGALADWRDADRARRLALAAAGTARAAAEAARADSGTSQGSWEACVGESAGYAASALAGNWPTGRGDRTARNAARLIRRRLPCPRLG